MSTSPNEVISTSPTEAATDPTADMRVFEYAINLVCAPYAFPFSVQFFLGDIPRGLSPDQYSSARSWIGEQYVMPARPAGKPRMYGRSLDGGQQEQQQQDYAEDEHALLALGADQTSPVADINHYGGTQTMLAARLPDDFLKRAVRYSFPLTRPLSERLRRSPSSIPTPALCSYLAANLRWLVVRPFVGEVKDRNLPMRLWVIRREVRESANGERTFGKPEIVWDATRGKMWGLQPGELPQVEPK